MFLAYSAARIDHCSFSYTYIGKEGVAVVAVDEAKRTAHTRGKHGYERHESLEPNGYPHRQCDKDAEMDKMLAEEDEHGLIKHVDIAERRLLCALTLIVEYG